MTSHSRRTPTFEVVPPKQLRHYGHVVELDVVSDTVNPNIVFPAIGNHCEVLSAIALDFHDNAVHIARQQVVEEGSPRHNGSDKSNDLGVEVERLVDFVERKTVVFFGMIGSNVEMIQQEWKIVLYLRDD